MIKPNTTREALIAELLGDMDNLLSRVDALPAHIAESEKNLKNTLIALENGSDKYRIAITAFNEQAKKELSEYLDRKTMESIVKIENNQVAAIQEATKIALNEYNQGKGSRIIETSLIAITASSLTGIIIYMLGSLH